MTAPAEVGGNPESRSPTDTGEPQEHRPPIDAVDSQERRTNDDEVRTPEGHGNHEELAGNRSGHLQRDDNGADMEQPMVENGNHPSMYEEDRIEPVEDSHANYRQERNMPIERDDSLGNYGELQNEGQAGGVKSSDHDNANAENGKPPTAPPINGQQDEAKAREAQNASTAPPGAGENADRITGTNTAITDDPASAQVNLFVRNVAKHVTEEQLVNLFSQYGHVDSAVVVRDPHSRECRGFGFVKMMNETEAVKALEIFQNFEFEGRQISAERAKRKNPHSRTPGAYMGIDKRIQTRYAGMKRSREYETGYGPAPYDTYNMPRRGGFRHRGHYPGGGRGQYYDRGPWAPRDSRMPMRASYDERERTRHRSDAPQNAEHDNRYQDREPPVPREPTDEFV